MAYQPPFTITTPILNLVSDISEMIGRLSFEFESKADGAVRLRKINRIKTIQGSLAIEGNTLSEQQISAILDGKRIIAPPKEVKEAHNAIAAYELLNEWKPSKIDDLLSAHKKLMIGIIEDAGMFRHSGVGVMSGDSVVHMAPQADRVPKLVSELLMWLTQTDCHALIASCVFHYEFEFIHPFSDGNGRMGRLWQTLILSQWNELFVHIPVESLVYEHQDEYYSAIRQSTAKTDASFFIEFMLQMILASIQATANRTLNDGISDGISDGIKLSDLDNEIIKLMKQNGFITNNSMAEILGKSIRTIERRTKYLKDNQVIRREGSKKSGQWVIC